MYLVFSLIEKSHVFDQFRTTVGALSLINFYISLWIVLYTIFVSGCFHILCNAGMRCSDGFLRELYELRGMCTGLYPVANGVVAAFLAGLVSERFGYR